MAKNVPIEVSQILDEIDITTLDMLSKLANNEKEIGGIINLLSHLMIRDQNLIVRGAGVATSMDTLIDTANKMSFSRGRMSGYSLINSCIKNAGRYLDKRMEKKSAKSS